LLHRTSPQSAVDNLEKWIENERAGKEKRKEAEAARRAKSFTDGTDGDDALMVPQILAPVAV